MRVVFVGSTRFGLRCLEAISNLDDVDIVGVITNPESFKISYSPQGVRNVLHADFSNWADVREVSCYTMKENMSEQALKSWLERNNPELLIVVGWYHIIPKHIRNICPVVGLHASLLPDYSGGAPLVWAIINGERQTGITLFQLSDGVDNGPILGQVAEIIKSDDTIATLYERIENLGIHLLMRYLPELANGTATFRRQDEDRRRIFPQRRPEDGKIDWTLSARRIHDFIRAQTKPYPGAFTFFREDKIYLRDSRILDTENSTPAPGQIRPMLEGIVIGCGDGKTIKVSRVGLGPLEVSATVWAIEQGMRHGERFYG